MDDFMDKGLAVEETAPTPNVTVRFKPTTPIEVELDVDQLTWEDMKVIRRASAQGASEDDAEQALFALLTKLTGKDMRLLPLRVVNAVIAQLGMLTNEMGNPKNSA